MAEAFCLPLKSEYKKMNPHMCILHNKIGRFVVSCGFRSVFYLTVKKNKIELCLMILYNQHYDKRYTGKSQAEIGDFC